MRNGDWRKCRDFIINSKMNAKVWDLFYEADKVREMLSRKIQEETLRTYLFTYSKVYNSISIVSTICLCIILKKTYIAIWFHVFFSPTFFCLAKLYIANARFTQNLSMFCLDPSTFAKLKSKWYNANNGFLFIMIQYLIKSFDIFKNQRNRWCTKWIFNIWQILNQIDKKLCLVTTKL